MDRTKAQAVQAHLEALESLGKLFETLWLEQMKQEVQGEKARAYLTVFEDIFPSIYHVVAYAKKTMPLLQQGGGDLSLLEQEGGQLADLLLGLAELGNGEIHIRAENEEPDGEGIIDAGGLVQDDAFFAQPEVEETAIQEEALEENQIEALFDGEEQEQVDEAGVDELFEPKGEATEAEVEAILNGQVEDEPPVEAEQKAEADLDPLIDSDGEDIELGAGISEAEMAALLDTDGEEGFDEDDGDGLDKLLEEDDEDEDLAELLDGEEDEEEDLAELLDGADDADAEEEGLAQLEEEDLSQLIDGEEGDLAGLSDEDEEEDAEDLAELLGEDDDEDDVEDLGELLGEVEGEDDDEEDDDGDLDELFAEDEGEELDELFDEEPDSAGDEEETEAEPAKKEAAASAEIDSDKDDDESISQDEIDALFG